MQQASGDFGGGDREETIMSTLGKGPGRTTGSVSRRKGVAAETSDRAAAGEPSRTRRSAKGEHAGDGIAPANVVVLCGRLSSDPQWRELASGSVLWTLEVTTPSEHGAASVPVALFDPVVEPTCAAGDEVYVVGEVRRRFFKGANGTQSRTEVVASEVVRTSQRAKVRASLQRLTDVIGRADGGGLRSP